MKYIQFNCSLAAVYFLPLHAEAKADGKGNWSLEYSVFPKNLNSKKLKSDCKYPDWTQNREKSCEFQDNGQQIKYKRYC